MAIHSLVQSGVTRRRSRSTAKRGARTPARRRDASGRRIENAEVARILREIADLLEIENANAFRIRAYRNAARVIEELPEPIQIVAAAEGRLEELPGIGKDLAGKIRDIVKTGSLPLLRKLERTSPAGVSEIMRVRGVGPKRAKILCGKLGIRSTSGLERAARQKRIRRIRGFGAKTEEAILHELEGRRVDEKRVLRPTATQYAEELVRYLKEDDSVKRVDIAGSIRRGRETVGDIDILVASDDPHSVVDRFTSYPSARDVLASGGTRAAIRLRSGLQVDLRVLDEKCYGAALHYFTGSKAHSIAIRKLGLKKGLKINEYGVHKGARWISGRDEADVFKAVGLPWIEPELREDRGEIEAAREGRLPSLVTLDDIRGDLQSHTTSSDGRDSLDAMAHAAEELGYEYLAVTDHTPSVRIAGGLDAQGFHRQWKRIDRLNSHLKKLTLLKGVEVDISATGTLDLRDSTLEGFDIVIASIHSHFNLSREEQTKRLMRAIAHPLVHMIAHPTARLIGHRQPLPIDLEAICRAAADSGVILEVDAQPERLDLDDTAIRTAIDLGVMLAVDTDAHSVAELRFMRWGVDQARRGWAERKNVANTRTLTQLLRILGK